jgi:hypothetical protein
MGKDRLSDGEWGRVIVLNPGSNTCVEAIGCSCDELVVCRRIFLIKETDIWK